ncbi:alanine racemase [Pullulanibacillus pueri]|uniref:Alanine racemase n=1 Tax=Pullulanibacillus pueri TaxID=1437324 RepID=A0A8J2ZZI6_9BACL|nr:alanine racemase [Pullulanibacillus pueri]MBM7683799.1 alanine racemase [Pullulanibacillus pueri]GGH87631.1 alanine racemase 1 [Pullulanibacillus pueri]
MDYYRDTWVEVNLDAIHSNIVNLKQYIPNETHIMAVVKADGYGHGATAVAREALESGATWLGVAFLDEAIALREDGIKAPILVLGWTRPSDIDLAVRFNISLTVFQKEWIETALKSYQSKLPAFIHLKCDTGMGRIGVRTDQELESVVKAVEKDNRFVIEGVFTHFATADEPDETYFNQQYGRFQEMLQSLKKFGVNPNIVHCGNSATGLKHPEKLFNMVRYGISLYGLSPSVEMKEKLPFALKEAFSLKTRLVHVKALEAGESVSYGATYTAAKPTWIGTLPVGYADGWLRKLAKVPLLIEGKRLPVVGRICMDQLMCQLDKAYPIGQEVTLIGTSGGECVSVDDIAGCLDTINYEITCMINRRVPRIYVKNGEKFLVKNSLLKDVYE